jgi:hypothetical protein
MFGFMKFYLEEYQENDNVDKLSRIHTKFIWDLSDFLLFSRDFRTLS